MSENALVTSTACLILRFRRPGIKRKLTEEQFSAADAEKELIDGNKKIIDSPEYGQVAAYEASVKHFLRSRALPSKLYRDSTYLIPLTSMKRVDEFLSKAQTEWEERVDGYVSVYPARKTETMKRLGSVAAESDYQSETALRAAFSMDYEYVTLSTPTSLKRISQEMFDREEERLKQRLRSAEEDIVAAYRNQFLETVREMKAMLAGEDKADGKPRRFSGWKIGKLVDTIEKFRTEDNVCGDDGLAQVMNEASKLLQGVDPKELKKDENWRKALADSFGGFTGELEKMLQVKGKRLITDDDEADAA